MMFNDFYECKIIRNQWWEEIFLMLTFCGECLLQLLEAAWCLTNIAAGNPEETKALLPALPLLIAHLGGE